MHLLFVLSQINTGKKSPVSVSASRAILFTCHPHSRGKIKGHQKCQSSVLWLGAFLLLLSCKLLKNMVKGGSGFTDSGIFYLIFRRLVQDWIKIEILVFTSDMHRLFWASLYTSDILNQPFILQKATWYCLTLIEWYNFMLAVIKLFCLVYSRFNFWWIWLRDSVGESTKQETISLSDSILGDNPQSSAEQRKQQ